MESERERAKQALRDDVNTMTGQNVHKLAATVEEADSDRILRVAAYCRVSTDDIDQVISIELQKNNYRDMIKANPKWKYNTEAVINFTIRYRPDIKPGMWVRYQDAKWYISTLGEYGFRRNYLSLKASLSKGVSG